MPTRSEAVLRGLEIIAKEYAVRFEHSFARRTLQRAKYFQPCIAGQLYLSFSDFVDQFFVGNIVMPRHEIQYPM